MGSGRRRLVFLFLFFLVVSRSTGAPASRSLKSVRHVVRSPSNFQYKGWIKDMGEARGLLERRMDIELMDYPETGANNNHDPNPPGRV